MDRYRHVIAVFTRTDALFRRRVPGLDSVTIWFCDRAIDAAVDDSVAAALLADGIHFFGRRPVSAAPRAPFCMIGNCFDCLGEIDGETNLQACLVTVRDGMRSRPHPGNGSGDRDDKGKA